MNEWRFNYQLSQPLTVISTTNDKILVLRNTHPFSSYFHHYSETPCRDYDYLCVTLPSWHLSVLCPPPPPTDMKFHSALLPYPLAYLCIPCLFSFLPSILHTCRNHHIPVQHHSHLPSLLPKGTCNYSWSCRLGLTRQTRSFKKHLLPSDAHTGFTYN